MSDDITLVGGGSVRVASDALLARADQLAQAAWQLETLGPLLAAAMAPAAQAGGVCGVGVGGGVVTGLRPAVVIDAELGDLPRRLAALSADAALLASAIRASAHAYGTADLVAERLVRSAAAAAGTAGGALWPVLAVAAIPSGVAAGVALLVVALAEGRDPRSVLADHAAVLSTPEAVGLLRAVASSADDAARAAAGIPLPLSLLLGDEYSRLAGTAATAGVLSGLAGAAGLLREMPVTVRRTERSSGAAPASGVADRAGRIADPGSRPGREQVRIDRYRMPDGTDRFEVYLAGTVDFAVTNTGEPWDMTSNVRGVAQLPSGSYRAVREAMSDAGITAHTPVLFTGYSQGGLLAALLAASGDYRTEAVVTFGAPAGGVEVPPEVPVLAVRHAEDIVPATGGYDLSRQALVIERTVFDGHPPTGGVAVPAHQLPLYRETAGLVDGARSAELRERLDRLARFGAGATEVETTRYRADRVVER